MPGERLLERMEAADVRPPVRFYRAIVEVRACHFFLCKCFFLDVPFRSRLKALTVVYTRL